jgi:hypothetical protein
MIAREHRQSKGALAMKLRLLLALAACIVGASVIPATAAADRPTKEEFSPVGDQIICGETVLTISSGTVVTRTKFMSFVPGCFA